MWFAIWFFDEFSIRDIQLIWISCKHGLNEETVHHFLLSNGHWLGSCVKKAIPPSLGSVLCWFCDILWNWPGAALVLSYSVYTGIFETQFNHFRFLLFQSFNYNFIIHSYLSAFYFQPKIMIYVCVSRLSVVFIRKQFSCCTWHSFIMIDILAIEEEEETG